MGAESSAQYRKMPLVLANGGAAVVERVNKDQVKGWFRERGLFHLIGDNILVLYQPDEKVRSGCSSEYSCTP